MKRRVFTQEQIAAARLRLLLDERLGRSTPDLVHQIARASAIDVHPYSAGGTAHVDVESWQAASLLELELVSE